MLDDLALFVSIVELGSLNAAARQAGLPAATVTRRLQRLEAELGCRLLHRSARRLQPSSEGWQYYERCRPLLQSLQQATEALDASLNRLSGVVRVLAPVNLACGPLQPAWGAFMRRYPELRLELQLSNLREDLLDHGADLAIRVGEQADSTLGQRRLGTVSTLLVASPGYLARVPALDHPAQLDGHALLLAEPLRLPTLRHRDSGEHYAVRPPATPRLRVNEIQLAVEMARAGLGVLHCPLTQCHHLLASGALVPVLPEWRSPSRPLYALWPQQRQLPARVRVLVDLLLEFARGEPLLNEPADALSIAYNRG